jgi:putative glutamine amidotransferase
MSTVLVSQRVEYLATRQEQRDCLDRRVVTMLHRCGLLAIPVPNVPALVDAAWDRAAPSGVVLSGGNDLLAYGGDSPERDATEGALLQRALAAGVPVLGICRGAQFLMHHFGTSLAAGEGHVATRHVVRGEWGEFATNSFHAFVPVAVASPLRAVMWAADGQVEAVQHQELPVVGVMWHPEREQPMNPVDLDLIGRLFRVRAPLEAV